MKIREIIQNAVTRTWAKVSNVTFTGWGTSSNPNTVPTLRISITQAATRPGDAQTFGFGETTLRTQGNSINFFLRTDTPADRIRYLTIHEFGHMLGLNHEDDSPERDVGCTRQQPWEECTQVGAWDRHSIMNSGCNDFGNSVGYLSKGDIWSIRSIYGIRKVSNHGDFSGKGTSSWGVWRPSTGEWFIDDGVTAPKVWGQSGDIPVPGDYNGDGKTDRAIWRPSTGEWFIDRWNGRLNSTFGISNDIPIPGDYLGEGLTRPALFRPSSGEWLFMAGRRPSNLPTTFRLGGSNDVPIAASFSGTGIIEPAVWDKLLHTFTFANGFTKVWGQVGDFPLPR